MELDEIQAVLESFSHRDWQQADEDAGPIRFAMVGLGWWTRDEALPAVEDSTLCETTVVVSGSTEKTEAVIDEHESVHTGLTYEEFGAGEAADAYDAVYVCTPNARHLEFVDIAADQGKAVLCEKPMEATVERAEEIVDSCRNADVTAMIAYRMHTEPAIRRARELLRAGVIGDPIHAHSDMSQGIIGWGADQWRLDPDRAGYGTSVMDLGIYSVNTTRFVLGRDPIAVQSMMHSDHEFFSAVPDEVAAFTVAFEDDIYATCTASQNAHLNSYLRIVGSEGVIRIEPAFHGESSLDVTSGETTIDVDTDQVNQMEAEFDYFADCFLSDREPYATPEHGLLDMRTLAAIYESNESAETIEI
ncbi:D-xylose 1-dehydrogenase Gfo6 [Halocatena salina]|uniref:Gfo/Idh/MocA family oxidoreductase n=1 Tax=Halocatena salina TaxID=2934340 RepID=A0A8U0A830_9EURY|nr:D-xylose 1-dehydrogenase Gfo6 [Halocatena salina]UPM44193.1 Gfo/Idh/MocA family oxidoreductase [Halocatena salina]